jgi:hypothetical protein
MERRLAKESAADQRQRHRELEDLQEKQERYLELANAARDQLRSALTCHMMANVTRDKLRASMSRLQTQLNESMVGAATVVKQKAHMEPRAKLAAMQQTWEEMTLKLASDDERIVDLAIQLETDAVEAAEQASEGRARAPETARREIDAFSAGSSADLCDLPVRVAPGKRSRADDAASMRSSCSMCPL